MRARPLLSAWTTALAGSGIVVLSACFSWCTSQREPATRAREQEPLFVSSNRVTRSDPPRMEKLDEGRTARLDEPLAQEKGGYELGTVGSFVKPLRVVS